MGTDGDRITRPWRGRTAWVLGLLGAAALSGAAAAGVGSTSTTASAVERAEPAASVETHEIRSGDHEGIEPPPVSPAEPLAAGRNELTERSPWAGLWGPEIEPLAAYDPQRWCMGGARPGVAAVARLLEQAYPQGRSLGIARACDVGLRSEHKEGRAYDWGLRITSPAERQAAEEFVAWLLATDEYGNDFAMARRLGVMYVIWDGHIWSASAAGDGWRVYRGASPHTDHVHLSFSWAGADGTTSFWDAARLGPWLFDGADIGRLPSSFDLGRDRYRSELGASPGSMRTWGEVPDPASPPSQDGAAAGGAGSADEGTQRAAPETTAAAPTVEPAPSSPATAPLLGPVTTAPLPTLAPVDPTTAPSNPVVVDEVGDALDEVVDEVVEQVDDTIAGLAG